MNKSMGYLKSMFIRILGFVEKRRCIIGAIVFQCGSYFKSKKLKKIFFHFFTQVIPPIKLERRNQKFLAFFSGFWKLYHVLPPCWKMDDEMEKAVGKGEAQRNICKDHDVIKLFKIYRAGKLADAN